MTVADTSLSVISNSHRLVLLNDATVNLEAFDCEIYGLTLPLIKTLALAIPNYQLK